MESNGRWFKKDVVQPMAALAEFTPYLASVASVAAMGPFEQRGGEFADPVMDPPPPQPLLYLPMVVGGKLIRALLDSGASDSFVSWDIVRVLGLRQYLLAQRLTVCVANGKALAIADSYRMTCPVVRVAKTGEGEAEVGKDLKEEDEGGA